MRFGGRLQLRDSHGPGLDVVLQLDEGHLQIATGGELLGRWGLDQVEAKRIGDDRFALVLEGERLDFLTHDPLAVVDIGLPAIEAGRARGRRGRRGRKRRQESPPAAPALERVAVAVEPGLIVETAAEALPKVAEPALVSGPAQAGTNGSDSTLKERVRRAATPLLDRIPGRESVPPDHQHLFQVHRLPGGLLRRVCARCGWVSIDVSD